MTTDAYLRYPHIRDDSVVFVAENDIWLASRDGGRAFRVSADHAPARSPRLSPDASRVAWTADRDGAFEVYVADADGGVSRRLTFWGQQRTQVRGWLSETEILVVSTVGLRRAAARVRPCGSGGRVPEPPAAVRLDRRHRARPGRRRPALDLDHRRAGLVEALPRRHRRAALARPHRRGRVQAGLRRPAVQPGLPAVDGRERTASSGSASSPTTRTAARSTARPWASVPRARRGSPGTPTARSTPGTRPPTARSVVYVAGGSLYLLDSLDPDATAREVDVRIGGARSSLQPKRVKAAGHLGTISPDPTGRSSAVETRGTVQLLTHRDGPVRALADGSGGTAPAAGRAR